MTTLFRKLRGIIGVGVTWGVVWGALGAMLGVVLGVLSPGSIDPGEAPFDIARILGTAGFISGAGFAVMLSLLERHHTILDISMRRVALWGAVGGAIVPLLSQVADNQIIWTSPLGALLATGAVAIARRAERLRLRAAGDTLPIAPTSRAVTPPA